MPQIHSGYRVGDSVKVKPGIKDPDFGAAIGGQRHHRWGKAAYQSIGMNRIFNVLVVIAHDIEKLVRYAPARGTGASQ